MHPRALITDHFRLTTDQKKALGRLGLVTIEDLLRHVPVRYESTEDIARTNALTPKDHVILYGAFKKLEAKKLWKSRKPATEGVFEDSAGRVKVLWFNQPYIATMYTVGVPVKITGVVAGTKENPYITNPEVELLHKSALAEGLFREAEVQAGTPTTFPVYPETRGITSRWFYHAMKRIFASGVLAELTDPIPEKARERYRLPSLADALIWIHTPEKKRHAEAARKRFSFEEMFLIQVARAQERAESDAIASFCIPDAGTKTQQFIKSLPFTLTKAQLRSIKDIIDAFGSTQPMARLLEGDVGAGKTAVAAATAYAVVTSRPPNRKSGTLQVAYMAPTEILATQHFESFIELFKHLPINIGLLTGSGCYKYPSKVSSEKPTKISRTQLLKWVENGEIAMLIGTHALIQKKVVFKDLAYVIVDEQHRFGTKQRRELTRKSDILPHFLSMTATPIPRTLALTIYGDLDISVLDELPPGRAKITTTLVTEKKRAAMYDKLRSELTSGRQGYVICPRIEEPDPEKALALRVKSAQAEAKRLEKTELQGFRIGLLHGKLTPAEKDAVMESFGRHEIDVLVATSVVEVGINVANATTILIEGAERFGLAQLHQLRGRVRRSTHEAHCYLLPSKALAPHSRDRLKALTKTDNGFLLAEEDLKLRGAGDLYGAKQWGISDIGMEALKNPRLIEAARSEAQTLIKRDPALKHHDLLREPVAKIRMRLHGE